MKGKKLFSTVLGLTLAATAHSWAITGGPWDHLSNDAYSNSNADGLYQATVTLKNGNGFLRFSTTKESQVVGPLDFANLSTVLNLIAQTSTTVPTSVLSGTLAANSNSVIFFEGNAYFGNTYGTVDLSSGSVTGVGSGQSMIVDQIQQSAQNAAENLNAVVDITGLSETMMINFVGKVTDRFPEIRFTAKGELNLFSRPGVTVVPAPNDETPPVIQVQNGGSVTTTNSDTRTITTNSGVTTNLPFGPTADNTSGTISNTNTDNRVQAIASATASTVVNGAALEPDQKAPIRLFGGRISRDPQVGSAAQRAAAAGTAPTGS